MRCHSTQFTVSELSFDTLSGILYEFTILNSLCGSFLFFARGGCSSTMDDMAIVGK